MRALSKKKGNIMKKLTTLFTTFLLSLGLLFVSSSAVAGPKANEAKGIPAQKVTLCRILLASGAWSNIAKNFGQCVQVFASGKNPKAPKDLDS
jgi:hypothetical protein